MRKIFLILIPFCILNTGLFAQWVAQSSGTDASLNSVFFTDSNTGYAVGERGTILKTTDGGTNWIQQVSGTTERLNSVYFTYAQTGYAVGSGVILKTTDSGATWIATANFGIGEYCTSVFFPNKTIGYIMAAGSNNNYKTTDGGSTWVPQSYSLNNQGRSVYFTDTLTGYAAGYNCILKTTDGGVTWIKHGGGNGFQSVYFVNKDTGYAVAQGSIAKTIDNGNNWALTDVKVPEGVHPFLYSVYFTNNTTGYVVGGDAINASPDIILKSSDGGINWKPQTTPRSWFLNSVFFPVPDTGYAVGYSGVILKTTNGGGDTIIIPPVSIREQDLSRVIRAYPNPATNKVTIDYNKFAYGVMHVVICDISGRQVVCESKCKNQTIEIDVRNLKAGIYFVKIYSDNSLVNVLKFVKEH